MDTKAIYIAIACGVVLFSLPWLVSSKTPPTAPATVTAPEERPSGAAATDDTDQRGTAAVMTRAQFDQIRPGMTYEQCAAVAGTAGSPIAPEKCRAQGADSGYTWLDPAGTVEFGLTFRNGLLVGRGFGQPARVQRQRAAAMRAEEARTSVLTDDEVRRLEQAALQSGQAVSVTLAEFQRIRPGASYEECAAIIGEDNPMGRLYAGPRNAAMTGTGSQTLSEAYKWPNPGGYYAELTFQNGRMTQKTWKQGNASTGGSARAASSNIPYK